MRRTVDRRQAAALLTAMAADRDEDLTLDVPAPAGVIGELSGPPRKQLADALKPRQGG